VTAKIRVGISSCLLGKNVRFDGGHQRDAYLCDTLGRWFEYVAVCPEVEVGLPIPRPALRLVGTPDAPRMEFSKSGEDLTDRMTRWAAARLDALAELDLGGYLLKSDSPSCGMERVRVYAGNGQAPRKGRGLFAHALMARFPLLPVEEEGRLHDVAIRDNWIERVFAFRRWRDAVAAGLTVGRLVAFHTAHKFQVLAHDPTRYRALGRLVAGAKAVPRAQLVELYGETFMAALTTRATAGKHANVLQHLAGFVSEALDAADRAELAHGVDEYRKGLVPLVVPLTLLRHHVRRHPSPYVEGQTYLEPHPRELMLRNPA
jgi:uncharacterized protein YbgA (DUF1722 family)/uncharacterized protein YbbK (DUF523 family)